METHPILSRLMVAEVYQMTLHQSFQNPKFCYYSNLGLAKLPDLLHQSSIFVSLVPYFWFELVLLKTTWMRTTYICVFFKHVIFEWILFCRVTYEEELGVLEVSAHHLRWAPKGAYFWNYPCSESVRSNACKNLCEFFYKKSGGTQWVVC